MIRKATALLLSSLPLQAQTPGPIFEDGEAQVVPAFADSETWIRHDLFVETEFDSDGDGRLDRMHVDVTRPAATEDGVKLAVVYATSPYYAGTSGLDFEYFWDPKHELGETPPVRPNPPEIEWQQRRPEISRTKVDYWVPRGFVVVHSCSPGTGMSQGCPTVGGKNESLAPKAVIDWLCGRARGFTEPEGGEEVTAFWSTGKVGMTGTSYNGTLPLAAATTGVEGLEAIIPVAPNTSYYHYYRENGLVLHPGGYLGEDIDVLYNFIHSGPPERREWCNENVRDGLMMARQDRVTGDWNDFWAGRDYALQLGQVHAATLMAHAFNDWNVMPEHSVRIFKRLQAAGVPVQCFFHQGGHGGDPPPRMMNRWFSRYLYGIENGVEEDPTSWVVREGKRRSEPTPYPDYPHPDAEPVLLRPSGKGDKVGELGTRPGRGKLTIVDDVSKKGAELAKAKASPSRLLFATPELDEPLHISGTGSVTLRLASSKPAANLSLWLVQLPWTDSRRVYDDVITRGWADPQNRNYESVSEPLVPG